MRSKLFLSTMITVLSFAGCGSTPGNTPDAATESGGTTGSGGKASSGGASGSGGITGSTGSGGKLGSGGATASGGAIGSGGASSGSGGSGSGGASGGATGAAGHQGMAGTTGAAGHGPMTGSGGRMGTTGSGGATGAGGAGATSGSGGATGAGGSSDTVDCSATLPSGGNTYTGSNVNGMVNGLNYGIWTNGSGGSITVFPNAHAFSTTWNNSSDFLAHLGLDFNSNKAYTSYGTISAQFSEKKSGSGGGFSSIGMYGWMHSPCIEWYINEDSYNGLGGKGSASATIDGGTYYLTMQMTNGTGGANACEAGHSGSWMQIHSTRSAARTCGVVTVSDHFAAWEKQGWTLGTLSSVHINVEVGGGSGTIEFPVANVTTTSK